VRKRALIAGRSAGLVGAVEKENANQPERHIGDIIFRAVAEMNASTCSARMNGTACSGKISSKP
jgi:hypothetical protein